MTILDTNVISETMKPQIFPAVQAWLDEQDKESIFLTATSLAELRLGIEILAPRRRKIFLTGILEKILSDFFADRVLPFDAEAATAYALILSRARSRGITIAAADGQIAAISAVHGFTIATRDTTPFLAAGLAVINPWTASAPS